MKLALLALLPCLLLAGQPDSIRVELVFSSESPADYNRWLTEHRAEFPELPHIRVAISKWDTTGSTHTCSVVFYDTLGQVIRTRSFSGKRINTGEGGPNKWFDARVSPGWNRLSVYRTDNSYSVDASVTVVYDAEGDSLFSVKGGGLWPWDGDRYFRTYTDEEGVPMSDSFEILDGNGNLIGKASPGGIMAGPTGWPKRSQNGIYAIFAEGRIVVVNRDAETLWKSGRTWPVDLNVSGDGRWVVASTLDSLFVRDLYAETTIVVPFVDSTTGQYAAPYLALADGDAGFAVYRQAMSASGQGARLESYSFQGRLRFAVDSIRTGGPRRLLYDGKRLLTLRPGQLVSIVQARAPQVVDGVGNPDVQYPIEHMHLHDHVAAIVAHDEMQVFRILSP